VTELVLDGAAMHTLADLHAQIARHPETPDWYGPSLDGLFDVLVAIYAPPITVVWHDAAGARERMGNDFDRAMRVFADARRFHSERGSMFRFEIVDGARPPASRAFTRLAVYCGSASPPDARYVALAREVGAVLARRGIGVVYGGGRLGLMGALADGALEAGGEVIGVIPEALVGREVAHKGLTELHVVTTMHERKKAFTDLSDGFVTLPGGVGTMDELWEAVSWAQLGYHGNPVGLLNAFGYYDGLMTFYRHMAATGFVRPDHAAILIAAGTMDALLDDMARYVPHRSVLQMQASEL